MHWDARRYVLSYLACLDKLRIIVNHAARLENHQLLGEVQRSDRAHLSLQLAAEVFLGCLLVADGDVVG
jgi:hypothetical protein